MSRSDLLDRIERVREQLKRGSTTPMAIDALLNEVCVVVATTSEESASRVRTALKTLSYSETMAAQAVIAELDGDQGLVVTSKVADRIGVTRSVIVNALSKLASAGVIEARSLGMKGTHIKIRAPELKVLLA